MLGRGRKRRKKYKRRVFDVLTDPVLKFPPLPNHPHPTTEYATDSEDTFMQEVFRTEKNSFGLIREYLSRPSFEPDQHMTIQDLSDFHLRSTIGTSSEEMMSNQIPLSLIRSAGAVDENWFNPFQNATICRLMDWFWNGSEKKSLADLEILVKQVLMADDFNRDDLKNFNAKREQDRLDEFAGIQSDHQGSLYSAHSLVSKSIQSSDSSSPHDSAGWRQEVVQIPIPDGKTHATLSDSPHFEVPGLFYRSLKEIIKSAFTSQDALRFHYTPFKHVWRSSEELGEQRVYSELYCSDRWLQEHEELQKQSSIDGIEKAIAGLMFWSDSTHLTNFGNASVWPIYLYFGNQSKYERARPSSHACHHVAYVPSVRFYLNII